MYIENTFCVNKIARNYVNETNKVYLIQTFLTT